MRTFPPARPRAGAYITIRFIGKRELSLVVAMSFHTASFFVGGVPLALGVPQVRRRGWRARAARGEGKAVLPLLPLL